MDFNLLTVIAFVVGALFGTLLARIDIGRKR